MKRTFVLTCTLVMAPALLLTAPARAGEQTPGLSEKSYRSARKVLEVGIQAMGGQQALQAVTDVSRTGLGTGYNQGQSLKPGTPYTTRMVKIRSVVDFAGKRSHTETATEFQGSIPLHFRTLLKGDVGFGVNLLTNVATPLSTVGLAGVKTALRRDPAALLLTAWSRAETLRPLGPGVITFADSDGTQIALYFDSKTHLLTKYETLGDNPVLGDALTEVVLSDYRPIGGVKLPFRVINRTAGELTQELEYSEVTVNTRPNDSLFEVPASAEKGLPFGPVTTVELTKLAEGIYFVAGSSHNSLLVAFDDHLMLVEAPLSEERSQAVITKIKEAVPGKPIRYLVPTHYHYDHSGGIRSFVAEGATIVTTPGNKSFIEKMAAAPHTIKPDRLSLQPRKPVIETFTKKRVFTAGTQTVELYDVGPNPHVTELVVAYLPKEKLIFVVDVFGIPLSGPVPAASPATRDFADKLKALGLQVERIASGHGKVGTMEDLQKALGVRASR